MFLFVTTAGYEVCGNTQERRVDLHLDDLPRHVEVAADHESVSFQRLEERTLSCLQPCCHLAETHDDRDSSGGYSHKWHFFKLLM